MYLLHQFLFSWLFLFQVYDGMREHAKNITIETEIAGGHTGTQNMTPWILEHSNTLIRLCLPKSKD